jgi:hypothetical protein
MSMTPFELFEAHVKICDRCQRGPASMCDAGKRLAEPVTGTHGRLVGVEVTDASWTLPETSPALARRLDDLIVLATQDDALTGGTDTLVHAMLRTAANGAGVQLATTGATDEQALRELGNLAAGFVKQAIAVRNAFQAAGARCTCQACQAKARATGQPSAVVH